MALEDQLDLVSSRVYPSLERKAGGPDNWVESTGGLPPYIDRIAKHLHYERGMTISRSIAVAVNTVKRWSRGGTVTKNGTTHRITPKTMAKAALAVGQWEAKKAAARATNLSELTREQKIILIDLAMTKDGRKSYKRQGKWGHGFVPLDAAARESKAKGSPIAARRVSRLYGGKAKKPQKVAVMQELETSKKGSTERVSRTALTRRATLTDATTAQRQKKSSAEHKLGGGGTKRSEKPWAEIPEAQKVMRNGKRYVQSIYRGQTQLVEWTGEQQGQVAPDTAKRVLVSLRSSDALKMSTPEIRKLLKTPGQPQSVKKILYAALRVQTKGKM